jgi:hypothetical protein
MVSSERLTVANDRDIVVFLIGMRINKWWRVWDWLSVVFAMLRMIKELKKNPASGLLHFEQLQGNPNLMVQYWESAEKLMAYAHDREGQHHPAWSAFNKKLARSGAVGIWHETYVVPAGQFECLYHHMTPFGLGRAIGTVPAKGRRAKAKDRLASPQPAMV